MQKILIIVHQETSNPGLVGQLLQDLGYSLDLRIPSIGQSLPQSMDSYDATIIFGGPMSANDEISHICTELDWIPTALASGKPFLGICLGAQLLSRVLGAKVAPHPQGIREIGYFPIMPTPEGESQFASLKYVYHWHSEGFELPIGSVRLAQGTVFPNQAFRYGKNAYGVQFHPEMTRELMKLWMMLAGEQLSLPGAQTQLQQLQLQAKHGRQAQQWLESFLPSWLIA